MGIKEKIIGWLYANLKIKISTIDKLLDTIDIDDDGYIEASELVLLIKEFATRRLKR